MKKRNRFLKIVSSITSCLAICGIFACSFLDQKKNGINAAATISPQLSDLTNANITFGNSDYFLANYRRTSSVTYFNYIDLYKSINFNNGLYGSLFKVTTAYNFQSYRTYKFVVTLGVQGNSIDDVFFSTGIFTSSNIERLDGNSNLTSFINLGSNTWSATIRVKSTFVVSQDSDVIRMRRISTSADVSNLSATYEFYSGAYDYEFEDATPYVTTFTDNLITLFNGASVQSHSSSNPGRAVNYRYYVYENLFPSFTCYVDGFLYNGIYVKLENYYINSESNWSYFDGFNITIKLLDLSGSYKNVVNPTIRLKDNYYSFDDYYYGGNYSLSLVSDTYLSIVGGSDCTNSDLLLIFNTLGVFKSFNDYEYGTISKEIYEQQINILENRINELELENSNLNTQLSNINTSTSEAYNLGYNAGVNSVENELPQAYQNGYSDGYTDGFSADNTVTTIFSGILTVAMVPVNFFLAIFNFNILGINLSAFIRAIFTVVLTIIVIKTVTGKGGGGSDS